MRGRVEHVRRILKHVFGFDKVHYQGIRNAESSLGLHVASVDQHDGEA